MVTLWKVYPAIVPDSVWLGRGFRQFDVPTEVVIGRGTSVEVPTQGRIWLSEFKKRPSGLVEHWKLRNDGKGLGIECQEVFEDHGDDGHTDYMLVGYRYVSAGTDPWKRENDE